MLHGLKSLENCDLETLSCNNSQSNYEVTGKLPADRENMCLLQPDMALTLSRGRGIFLAQSLV